MAEPISGTGNLCFELLDRPVVAGRSDDPLLGSTYARVLEDVAALAGVLRAVGVGAGERVLVDLADQAFALRAALATARLGAVLVTGAADAARLDTLLAGTAPAAVVTGRHAEVAPAVAAADPRPGTLLVHGGHGPLDEQHELDWDVAMRAGRTDPAPTVQVPLGSAALVHWPADADAPAIRSVAEQLAAVGTDPAGWDALLG